MIEMLRIDERLVHGQVAVSWSKVLGITHLVVINERVAKNEMQKMTLKLAVPNNVKFIVKNIEEGIQIINDPRGQAFRMLVIVENFQDALVICQNVSTIKVINIGNYGLLPINQHGGKQKEFATAVRVTEEDVQIIREIAQLTIPFEAQLTPDAPKKDVRKLLKGDV